MMKKRVCALLWVAMSVVHATDLAVPEDLQSAWKRCQSTAKDEVKCTALHAQLERLNHFAYQLRVNPLRFGQRVLTLQTWIAEQEDSMDNNTLSREQRMLLSERRQQLRDRLDVIKWLESPGG